MQKHKLTYNKPFELESGEVLPYLEITFHTAGTFDPTRNNVVWVCHALTGNSDVFDWWAGLFGIDDFFNPKDHFIVCANVLGSCYGSTGPLQTTDSTAFHRFPKLTIRDMVKAHDLLRQDLGISKIHTLIGGSLGGQQAVEWAISQSGLVENLILIATNARHSPWGIAFNESQRMAIETDATWQLNTPNAGIQGMKVARSMALISYRAYETYQSSQIDTELDKVDDFKASSYQQYQGEKLARRFNAFSYYLLSRAMDTHNVGRHRKSIKRALNLIAARTLVVGISSDGLFPTHEQQFLAQNIIGAKYAEIDSFYGHDGFLVETEKLASILDSFYTNTKTSLTKTANLL